MKSLNGKFHFAEKFKMNAAKSIKCKENNVYNVIFNELNDKLITYSRMFFCNFAHDFSILSTFVTKKKYVFMSL